MALGALDRVPKATFETGLHEVKEQQDHQAFRACREGADNGGRDRAGRYGSV